MKSVDNGYFKISRINADSENDGVKGPNIHRCLKQLKIKNKYTNKINKITALKSLLRQHKTVILERWKTN